MLEILFALIGGLWAHSTEITLIFAGDAMMHQSQINAARRSDGTYDLHTYFMEIDSVVKSADYAVVNLETPLGGGRLSGYPMFNAPDAYADALRDAGFDMCLTANNHTLDRSDAGLRRTLTILDECGLAHIGTYNDSADRDSLMPKVIDVNGVKIGMLNYTYGTNGMTPRRGAVVDYIDKKQIHNDILAARSAGAELICVCIHWGEEYKMLPNAAQRRLADWLVSEDVDMVIGGHPHVIQPMEMREGRNGENALVVYSLGNFISGMRTTDTRGGAMVEVTIGRGFTGRPYVKNAEYMLVYTETAYDGRNPRLIFAHRCESAVWRSRCAAFVKNARTILDKHNKNVPNKVKM